MSELEKAILLQSIDMFWVDHLDAIEHLRRGIGLQGYGQRDPLVEYKKEAYRMFSELLTAIDKYVAMAVFKVQIATEVAEQQLQTSLPGAGKLHLVGPAKEGDEHVADDPVTDERFKDVGRNDPCPCGSGKKFKKCHGSES